MAVSLFDKNLLPMIRLIKIQVDGFSNSFVWSKKVFPHCFNIYVNNPAFQVIASSLGIKVGNKIVGTLYVDTFYLSNIKKRI